MQKGKDMHFVLDAAHFTDYRVQRKDYKVLAKLPDTVSFSVVTSEDNFVFDIFRNSKGLFLSVKNAFIHFN